MNSDMGTKRIRAPYLAELEDLSAMCLRSKAVWGYDQAFVEACKEELTIKPSELESTMIGVAECENQALGMAQLDFDGGSAILEKLYVDPTQRGTGVGDLLMRWVIETAVASGARRLRIEADPHAADFYRRYGAAIIGEAPSGSIAGRFLPLLELDLTRRGM